MQEGEEWAWEVEEEGGEAENRGMDIVLVRADSWELSKKNSQYNSAGRANARKLSFTLTFLSLLRLLLISLSVSCTLLCSSEDKPGITPTVSMCLYLKMI